MKEFNVETCIWFSLMIVLLVFVYAALSLILPIVKPKIIEYPWKLPTLSRIRARDKEKVVILAGSYNPPHNGHLAMLEYLSQRYGQVIAVVGMNPNKKYLVSPEERVELIQSMLDTNPKLKNVRAQGTFIQLESFEIFLVAHFTLFLHSCIGIRLEICQTRRSKCILSGCSKLGKGWQGRTEFTNSQYVGTTLSRSYLACSYSLFGRKARIQSCLFDTYSQHLSRRSYYCGVSIKSCTKSSD
mmetsp:Transcript_24781/g.44824  ORF Transcript_24781/g.44824 Transcript_24781/m.44824 type:complete len:242 (-) Transcript_24781:63-788(-)